MQRHSALPASAVAAPAPWARQIARRWRTLLALKTLGITAFMWLFFLGYFHLLRHPSYAVTVMPLTPLDRWLDFQPAWLPVYLTLWLYVGIAPGLMPTLRQLIVYGLWAAALCLGGFAIFHWWPTAVPLRPMDVSQHPGFALLQGVDAAGNACPSLHVATAMFSALRLHAILREVAAPRALRAANVAWLLAIAYSTVAIRQHVVLDAVAGAALGAAVAWASLRWAGRRPLISSTVAAPQGFWVRWRRLLAERE